MRCAGAFRYSIVQLGKMGRVFCEDTAVEGKLGADDDW